MKKYIILAITTLVSVAVLLSTPKIAEVSAIKVDTAYPTITDFENTVECKGTLASSNKIPVRFDYPLVISEIVVKTGDKIEAGDVLFKIDAEGTAEKVKEIYPDIDINSYLNGAEIPREYKAETDGVISTISVPADNFLKAGETIITINGGSGFIAVISINESDISSVKLGQDVKITGVAFKDKVYMGKVTEISNVATQENLGSSKQTVVNATVELIESDELMKSGYNVKASIVTEIKRNVLSVPYEAIKEDKNNYYVYKLVDGRWAQEVQVDILYEDENGVIVEGDITPKTQLCLYSDTFEQPVTRVSLNVDGVKY